MSEKAMAPVREMQMASDWVAAVLQLGRMVIMDMICLFVWGGCGFMGCGGFGEGVGGFFGSLEGWLW
jgi:hypothetical protein